MSTTRPRPSLHEQLRREEAQRRFDRDRALVAQMAASMYAGILMTSISHSLMGNQAREQTRALCVEEAFTILEAIDARRP